MDADQQIEISRGQLYYVIWTVAFGVTLALGGSLLETLQIPFLYVTFATPWVAFILTLNKLVIYRPLSVTGMYVIASIIAIFTYYLGPPNPLKILFIFAGFTFDLGTLFRTTKLRLWNIWGGHLLSTISGFFFFAVMFYFTAPKALPALLPILYIAAPIHFVICVAISSFLYKIIPSESPPELVQRIRAQLALK